MFSTVLVANRGEIAVRIIRTLRTMGIRSVAVFSDADADARHVAEADVAYRIGAAPAIESYLNVERIMEAAVASGAQALHPGYGFLSERPAVAEACRAAGIAFVGPPVGAIIAMGDKIRAKELVSAAGVRVVPGRGAPGMSDAQVADAAREVGLPVLLKPSAGGGGKGMRLVRDLSVLSAEIASSRREARNAFGDDTLLVERFVERPRHIEIQVLADQHGNVVHLGERECTLQRRHQKIVEEAPSVFLTPEVREAMGAQAVSCARTCAYEGAGTVEFIVSGNNPADFFFMEMNTRLQVEHPVTEMVYGVDLVEWQLRIAAGEKLGFDQSQLRAQGHAVEARVYAEDPASGFLPTGGTVLAMTEPSGVGVRVDSGLRVGSVIGSDYDPMLAKVIAHATTRSEAFARLDRALSTTRVLGVTSNVDFLRALINVQEVLAGDLDTGLVERRLPELVANTSGHNATDVALIAAALFLNRRLAGEMASPWAVSDGWRVSGTAAIERRLSAGGKEECQISLRHQGTEGGLEMWAVAIDGRPEQHCNLAFVQGRGVLRIGSALTSVEVAHRDLVTWVATADGVWSVREVAPVPLRGNRGATAAAKAISSPMPGKVVAVYVTIGDVVEEGQPLVVVEAMKMEHTLAANQAGSVESVLVGPGAQVALGDVLIVVTATAG